MQNRPNNLDEFRLHLFQFETRAGRAVGFMACCMILVLEAVFGPGILLEE
jgi:hypothetical protein